MPTNPHFNLFRATNEQELWENLIIEAIQIYGHDVKYIPRQLVKYDELYGEDQLSTYSTNYDIEVYIKSIDGFEGDGQFLSKFMNEMRDQVTLTMAIRTYKQLVGDYENSERPKEGDLIFFPLSGGLFQIKFCNTRPYFYMHGALQTYDLVCELFEYSGEVFDTSIDIVDGMQTNYSTDIVANPTLDLDEAPSDFLSDNEVIESESDDVLDFDENNPFGDPD
jgi:hypothetical protein